MPIPAGPRMRTIHVCELETGSNSCLPRLSPQTGKFKRSLRNFHKGTIASAGNPRTKDYLRSISAVTAEKRRHVHAPYWYVIHPFSKFSMYREITMCVVWLVAFLFDPFLMAFYHAHDIYEMEHLIKLIISIVIEVSLYAHMILSFLMGYVIPKTKEIVLQPRHIMFNYLGSYFIFDLLGTVPPSKIIGIARAQVCGLGREEEVFSEGLGMYIYLRFIRAGTMIRYLRQVTMLFKVGNTLHECICLTIVTIYLIHWWTCMVYFLPKLDFFMYNVLSDKSWITMAKLDPRIATPVYRLYGESLLMTLAHFYAAGTGMYYTDEPNEFFLFSLIYISGSVYCAYIIIMMFEIVTSTNASESKYEEIVYQLREYMQSKSLPQHLRYRLLLYYKNRFQERYFREQAILSTISDHLREEIFLHACRSLVEKVKVFEGMSKHAVGNIVACLKFEVYLTQDAIIKAGDPSESIFFISHGTVAVYLPNGIEILHYEDGDHFGEIPLVLKDIKEEGLLTCIAAEISECFRMSKKDLMHCLAANEHFAKIMRSIAAKRYDHLDELIIETAGEEHQRDVLHQLRAGKILDRTRRRQRLTKK